MSMTNWPVTQSGGRFLVACKHLFHSRCVGDAQHDNVTGTGHLGRAVGPAGTGFEHILQAVGTPSRDRRPAGLPAVSRITIGLPIRPMPMKPIRSGADVSCLTFWFLWGRSIGYCRLPFRHSVPDVDGAKR